MKTTKSWCVRCFKHQIILNTEFHSITGWWWWGTGTYKNTFLLSVYKWNAWILYINCELECNRWFYDVCRRASAGRQISRRWRTPEEIVIGDFLAIIRKHLLAASKLRISRVVTSNGDNSQCPSLLRTMLHLEYPPYFYSSTFFQRKSPSKTATAIARQCQTEKKYSTFT